MLLPGPLYLSEMAALKIQHISRVGYYGPTEMGTVYQMSGNSSSGPKLQGRRASVCNIWPRATQLRSSHQVP